MYSIRNNRYYILMAFYVSCFILSSCSSSKKTTSEVPIKKKQLNEDQRTEFTSNYFDATTKKILGDYDKALSLYLQCISIDPTNAAANYEMADILEYDKEPDSALMYAKRAVELEPANVWYQDLYAQCLQDKGRYKDVADVYRGLVKAHPDVAEYYYKLAISELQAGEYDDATKTYDVEEQKFGFNEDVVMSKIQIYEKLKNYSGAEQEIQKLIKRNPSNPQYYDMLGNLYEIQGKSDKAFEVYQHMEQTSPHDPMVHLSLADYYRTMHNDKKSYEELKLAFAEPSLEIDTKIRILLSFYTVSNGHDTLNDEALELCRIMMKADSNEPTAHKMYGDFLLRNKEYKEAQNQYMITLSEDSSKYTVWSQMLALDEIIGDYNSMLNVSKGAINLFPNYPQPYLASGVANLELKHYNESLSSLYKGLNYVVDDSALLEEFLSYLGAVNNTLGHYSASDSAYDQALKLSPNDNQVLNNYSYYLSLRDTNLNKAASMSKKANELAPNDYNYEDTYSWIFYKMGKYQDAKDWEDKSLQSGGSSHSDILDHYGDILFKMGDKGGAVEYWQKAKDAGMKDELLEKKIRDKQLYEK